MNMIRSIDFLGPEVSFNIANHRIFKTRFGGIASLILLALAILAFLGFGRDIFEKKQPRVTFNRITDAEDIQHKYLTDSNFLFSIYDQYTDQPIPDFDRRFEVYYDFLDFRGDGMIDKNFRNPFEKCSEETLKLFTDYLNLEPSSYYCFPKGPEIELMGVMSQGKSSMARLQVDFCKNNTDITKGKIKTDCYSKQETQIFLASNRIQMHYIIETANIDSTNYLKPGSRYIYSNSINTNAFSWTRLNILFKKIVVDTDIGFFVEDKKHWEIMALESIASESIYSPATDTVFSFLIGNSPWKEIYSRYYIKIQDVFAMMGGFLNALFIILKFIVEFIVKPNLVNLFNKIYKYEVYDSFNKSKMKTGIDTNSNLTKMKNNFMDSSIFPDMNNSKFKISQLDNNLKFEIKRSDLISENGNEFILQLIRKKRNKVYHAKMSNFKKIFRCFLTGNNDKQINFYKMIETKLKKLISFEHFIKVTKNVKVFREIFLENHQNQIIKMSQAPRSKKGSESMDTEKISENLVKGINEEKLQGEKNTAKVDTKLFEILLG
jgi:hypothetical protein